MMCLSLQSFHLGVERHENTRCRDATTTEQDWTAQAWTGLSRPFSCIFESTENRKLVTHLLDMCLLGFAFCPSFHPPEELSLETWVETSLLHPSSVPPCVCCPLYVPPKLQETFGFLCVGAAEQTQLSGPHKVTPGLSALAQFNLGFLV